MPASRNKSMMGLYVSKELKAELEELAKQEKRSLSNYITVILEEHMKQKKMQNNNEKKG